MKKPMGSSASIEMIPLFPDVVTNKDLDFLDAIILVTVPITFLLTRWLLRRA